MYVLCMALIDTEHQRQWQSCEQLPATEFTTADDVTPKQTFASADSISVVVLHRTIDRVQTLLLVLLTAHTVAIGITIDHTQLSIAAVSFVGSFWQRHSPTPKHRSTRTPFACTVAA